MTLQTKLKDGFITMSNQINENLLLIGYMGSGKTTVAKALSHMTGFRVIDMDEEIESIEGMPIRKMFMLYGEHEFRNKESELLDKLCNITSAVDVMSGGEGAIAKMKEKASKYASFENLKEPVIVSCGGGIILDDLNRTILKKQCTIFLKGDPKLLFERIKEDSNRPNAFLDIMDEEERLNQFLNRYEHRKNFYEETANYTVSIDEKTPEMIAKEILEQIK